MNPRTPERLAPQASAFGQAGRHPQRKFSCMVFIILGYFFVHMLIPVRCFTCGNLVADKYDDYQNKVKAGEDPVKALGFLGN